MRTCDLCVRKTADINIRDVADDASIYQPSAHLEAAGTGLGWIGEDSEAYVRSHVRQLEVLHRAGRVEYIMRNAGGVEWGFDRFCIAPVCCRCTSRRFAAMRQTSAIGVEGQKSSAGMRPDVVRANCVKIEGSIPIAGGKCSVPLKEPNALRRAKLETNPRRDRI